MDEDPATTTQDVLPLLASSPPKLDETDQMDTTKPDEDEGESGEYMAKHDTHGLEEQVKAILNEEMELESTSGVHDHDNLETENKRTRVAISPIINQGSSSSTHNLEDRRKLEIRLSRLPESIATGTVADETETTFGDESSLSSSPSPTTSASEERSPERKSVQQERVSTSERLASRRHILQSRKRATALKRKKPSTTFGPVKIKMNFLTRKLAKTIDGEQKSKKEIDFETKERDAAAAAEEAYKRSLAESKAESELHKLDPRFSKPFLPSSPDGSSDSSDSEDDYCYRPIRAAAAAALEAVVHGKQKDSDFRQKPGNFSPKQAIKGRGRRSLVKRTPKKGVVHNSEMDLEFGFHQRLSIFHNDTYFQAGDIVNIDGADYEEDGVTTVVYYAQITHLMSTPSGRHSVEIVWLTPNTTCHRLPFHPENYDRRDDVPRMTVAIECCDLEMRLPEDYFTKRRSEDYYQLNSRLPVVYQRLSDSEFDFPDLLISEDEESVEIKMESADEDLKCEVEFNDAEVS